MTNFLMGWTRETSEFVLAMLLTKSIIYKIQNQYLPRKDHLAPQHFGHSMMCNEWCECESKPHYLSHLKPATKLNLFSHFCLPTLSFDLLLLKYEIKPYMCMHVNMQAHSEEQIAEEQKECGERDYLLPWIKQNMWKCTYSSSFTCYIL